MNQTAPTMEHRITLRLLAYWEKLRRGRDMPLEQDIVPDDIKDLWGNCFIVRIKDSCPPNYQFAHMGDAVARVYRGALCEDNPESFICPDGVYLSGRYEDMLNTAKPIIDEGEFHNSHGELIKYRQCLLPLGENGRITAIFGGMRYKIFTPT